MDKRRVDYILEELGLRLQHQLLVGDDIVAEVCT